jgi:hypothetical protein
MRERTVDAWLKTAPPHELGPRESAAVDNAHVFNAPESNATREKKFDAFGRWYWADGKIY